MADISSAPDQLNQNGHNESEKSKSITNSAQQAIVSPHLESVALPSDDWSSITKEIIDALPRVWTRGLLYFLITFAVIVLPWASLSKVDETGSARGRIEPKGKTVRLDAQAEGVVSKIQVKEGQAVKAGQVLLELDAELSKTQLQQAQAKLDGEQNRLAQFEIMKNQLEIGLRAQQQQNQAQQSVQQAQLDQTQQQLNFSRNASELAQDRLGMDQNEVQRYQKLQEEGVVPQVKVVEVNRARAESKRVLSQAQSDLKQAQYKLNEQQSQYENTIRTGQLATLDAERRFKEMQSQISDTRAEITQTTKQIQALQLQLNQRVLRAPINGTIFKLAIENAGAVLQPGQAIAQIAPEGSPLIFRAQIPSHDSGFLQVGLPVKLKFDAYPFQDYGVVPGHLNWISPDSSAIETSQGKAETFELEVALDQNFISTQNKHIALTPGQTATAEVIVRQRRIIDFILDPFKKLQKGELKL